MKNTKKYRPYGRIKAERRNKKIKIQTIKCALIASVIVSIVLYTQKWYVNGVLASIEATGQYNVDYKAPKTIEGEEIAKGYSKQDFYKTIEQNNHSKYRTNYIYDMTLKCENIRFDPDVCNPIVTTTGNACGMNQFTTVTWMEGIRRFEPDWKNVDIFDPHKNTIMMMHFINAGEIWRWACFK